MNYSLYARANVQFSVGTELASIKSTLFCVILHQIVYDFFRDRWQAYAAGLHNSVNSKDYLNIKCCSVGFITELVYGL